MSGKQKRRQLADRRRRRQDEADTSAANNRKSHKSKLPEGAILADLSQQVPNNSYDAPTEFYVDLAFTCVDCGVAQVWKAEQQKWYYEVAKGTLYATAIRCRQCRQAHREAKNGQQGDPHPIKHEGALIKRVESSVRPRLESAGFELLGKQRLDNSWSMALNFRRDDLELTCWFDAREGMLKAETIDHSANCTPVATVLLYPLRDHSQLVEYIETFAARVIQYVAGQKSID